MTNEVEKRAQGIELLILDVDGVLTDGVIAVDDLGVETKHFHVRDGAGIALWRKAGKRVAILSGRSARCVDIRAAELGITPGHSRVRRTKGPRFEAILDELRACPGSSLPRRRRPCRSAGFSKASWARRVPFGRRARGCRLGAPRDGRERRSRARFARSSR